MKIMGFGMVVDVECPGCDQALFPVGCNYALSAEEYLALPEEKRRCECTGCGGVGRKSCDHRLMSSCELPPNHPGMHRKGSIFWLRKIGGQL